MVKVKISREVESKYFKFVDTHDTKDIKDVYTAIDSHEVDVILVLWINEFGFNSVSYLREEVERNFKSGRWNIVEILDEV